jgi:Flp pilus assembly protein TadG
MIEPTKASPGLRRSAACRPRPRPRGKRRGNALAFLSLGLVVLCGFASLAVDYGRVQVAKTELQAAADLAARYAATGVKHEIEGISAAKAMAKFALAENKVNSQAIKDTQMTVTLGRWNTNSKQFTPDNDVKHVNAVRVTVTCSAADNTAVALPFASVLGLTSQSLSASSIALYDADRYLTAGNDAEDDEEVDGNDVSFVQKYVPATSNPWLAGMSDGTWAGVGNPANSPDRAGNSGDVRQSPVLMKNLRLVSGSTLTFDGVNGGANNSNNVIRYTGDGNTGWCINNFGGSELGKSNIKAPINSVIAVFLNDDEPGGTPPPSLDFSTAASRDFHSLKPQLNQMFFIGDGRRANGDMQQFVIPPGAKRLFVGTMDGWEWNNNVGGFTVTATSVAKIVTVK